MPFLPSTEALVKYLSDMSAAEYHLMETVRIQQGDVFLGQISAAVDVVARIREVAASHVAALHDLLDKLDGTARLHFKESIATFTGAALGLTEKMRTHSVSKMLRDDYVALNLNAIGYTMLHTTGLALNSPETAALALNHLRAVTPLIMELSQVIVPVVITELGETSRVDPTAAEAALSNTRTCWGLRGSVATWYSLPASRNAAEKSQAK